MRMKQPFVLINMINGIRPDTRHRILGRANLLYFSDIVNEFTCTGFMSPLKRGFNGVSMRGTSATPLRAIRRVHVMPHATPIRRIGKTRKGYLCPEDYASYKENRYRKGAWILSLNYIVDFLHFCFITYINNENYRAICFS
jgi:hypothetical protein